MPYDVPGSADQVSEVVRAAWNERVEQEFDRQGASFASRFLVLDPATIPGARTSDAARWPASPAEPRFCRSVDVARKLSDAGVRGREILHNEYAEYHVTFAVDDEGRRRPKRVEVTTELREYWLTLAVADPDKLQEAAEAVLGRSVPFVELYGSGGENPGALSPRQREQRFSAVLGGDGQGSRPMGALNRDHALFMAHPINGLDDLIFIVAFGAIPRRARDDGGFRKAAIHEIFIEESRGDLACRNADPAAAAAAHDAAWQGVTVAFADPLGMYLLDFQADAFTLASSQEPIPEHWARFSRGGDRPGRAQRLEFGPPDDEPFFLDDIVVSVGAEDRPLAGGYDVADRLEVGPLLAAGQPSDVADDEFRTIPAAPEFNCRQGAVCDTIRRLEEQLQTEEGLVRTGGRRIGGGG